jgi:hypothetical protein
MCTMRAGAAHALQALWQCKAAVANCAVQQAHAEALWRPSPLQLPCQLEPSPFDISRLPSSTSVEGQGDSSACAAQAQPAADAASPTVVNELAADDTGACGDCPSMVRWASLRLQQQLGRSLTAAEQAALEEDEAAIQERCRLLSSRYGDFKHAEQLLKSAGRGSAHPARHCAGQRG